MQDLQAEVFLERSAWKAGGEATAGQVRWNNCLCVSISDEHSSVSQLPLCTHPALLVEGSLTLFGDHVSIAL